MNTNSSSKSHKRKGSEEGEEHSYASVHRSVVFSPPATTSSFRTRSQYKSSNSTWEETQRQLESFHGYLLRHRDKGRDPVLAKLQTKLLQRSTLATRSAQDKKQHAVNILQKLADKIEAATTQHELMTAEQQQLQLQVTALQQQATQYTGQLQETADQQHELMQEIAGYTNQADQFLAELRNNNNAKYDDDPQKQHGAGVVDLPTKLRYLLSLYARCTGIKWEYADKDENENADNNNHMKKTPARSSKKSQVLQGEVTIPSEELVRRFVLDPAGLSDFDMAQRLWGIMEGIKDISTTNHSNNLATTASAH